MSGEVAWRIMLMGESAVFWCNSQECVSGRLDLAPASFLSPGDKQSGQPLAHT